MSPWPVPTELPDEPAGPSPLALAQRRHGDFRLIEEPEQFKAIATYPITADLEAVGCVGVLAAATLVELEELCTAERMKRGRAAAARHE